MKIPWRTLFLVVVLLGVLWLGYTARAVVTPLVAALLLAYMLDPVVRRLQRLGISRSMASAALVAATLVVLVGVGSWGGTAVVSEAARFYEEVVGEPAAGGDDVAATRAFRAQSIDVASVRIAQTTWRGEPMWFVDLDGDGKFEPGLARQTTAAVQDVLEQNEWTRRLATQVGATANLAPMLASTSSKWLSSVFSGGQTVAGEALGLLTLVFLFPIYLYYSLEKLDRVYDVGVAHLPAAHRERIVSILARIHATLAAFFRGRLILLAVRFAVLLVVFAAFQTPFFFVCAMFGAVASLVPVLGSVAAIAVPVAVSVASGATGGELLGLTALLVVFEVVEQYVLTPAVVGKSVGLHPLTILVATLVAGDLLGIFGMLVAIPLAAVVKILWIEFVMPEIRRQAGIPEPPDSGSASAASVGESGSA